MKILIVDNQQLILLSLEKLLSGLGYEVISADNIMDAIARYDSEKPNLIIVDINMSNLSNIESINEDTSGLDVDKHIKQIKKDNTPVMILSSNIDEEVIIKCFDLGIDDYMKKPLSLGEIGARVKRLIGSTIEKSLIEKTNSKEQYIQNKCIGVVIPCYNEETRLSSDEFESFVHKNLGYHLCYINDGSKDNTLTVLNELTKGKEEYISVYDCVKNVGKAEAVRLGMLHLAKQNQFDYIGFLDADLSTNFDDFQHMADTIYNSKYKLVFGSRISRMGADIAKQSARAIISKTFNYIIRKILGTEINDTQCGAKIMTKEIIEKTFNEKFITKCFFDVEIFIRMKKIYGPEKMQKLILEKPLNRWIHIDGSKLSFKDSIKIIGQVGQITVHYRQKPQLIKSAL